MIVLKSSAQFSEVDKATIRELFGSQVPGQHEELVRQIDNLKEENSRLFFDLKNALEHQHQEL